MTSRRDRKFQFPLINYLTFFPCRLCQHADRRLAEAAARRLHPHVRRPLREELGALRRLLPAHPGLLLEGRRGRPPGGHHQVLHRALQENVPGERVFCTPGQWRKNGQLANSLSNWNKKEMSL